MQIGRILQLRFHAIHVSFHINMVKIKQPWTYVLVTDKRIFFIILSDIIFFYNLIRKYILNKGTKISRNLYHSYRISCVSQTRALARVYLISVYWSFYAEKIFIGAHAFTIQRFFSPRSSMISFLYSISLSYSLAFSPRSTILRLRSEIEKITWNDQTSRHFQWDQ